MSGGVAALAIHARAVPATERAALAAALRASRPAGSVLLETCHRVELYGRADALAPLAAPVLRGGGRALVGDDAARRVIVVAVGRDSAVVAEDQVLHQLRQSVQAARSEARLGPELDHLLDLALSAGRRARSWLPSRRPSLADLALDRVAAVDRPDRPVLVVGAGAMGALTARALAGRGRRVLVASRSSERARALAAAVGGDATPFDPGPGAVPSLTGVIIALAGPWSAAPATLDRLASGRGWLVDLSAPPAVGSDVAARLGDRFVSIDDFARSDAAGTAGGALRPTLIARLDALVADTLAAFRAWEGQERQRAAASALAERALEARDVELRALWRRLPAIDPRAREEIEAMARRLSERLLRQPLERLGADRDGRHVRAARELFGL